MVLMYKIPESWGVKREPRTPEEERKNIITQGFPYDEMFDWDTLFNEAISLGDGRALLIGPPLYELKKLIRFELNGQPLRVQFEDKINVGLTIVHTDMINFTLVNPKGNVEIIVNPRSTEFADMGCISTMQKNEPIHWIKDWIQYHHLAHGVDGFIIYDNNSDQYTVDELQTELESLPFNIAIRVVPWNVPFGPHTPKWDSNFSQFTQLEHWKFKYAWCSNFAINQDIDELLVTAGCTIDDVLEKIRTEKLPGIIYRTRNIDPFNERLETSAHKLPVSERRFKDYYFYSEYNNTNNTRVGKRLLYKWITIPNHSMNLQWSVHDFGYIYDNKSIKVQPESGLYFAHMYAMQSKHKDRHPSFYNRNQQLVEITDLNVDEALKNTLMKVFE